MDVLSLQGKISLDSSGYNSALDGAKTKAQGFGNTLKGILGAQVITKGFNAITNGFKSVMEAGMTFDSSMAQVAATMGLTMDSMEVDTLRNFAQEMGSKTAWSATQCADALNFMALAGYDVETSQRMLPQVLNLASAGSMDLARASDMVTDAQTALGLSLEDTETMVDQMAKTASTTNTSVEQLGDAILTVGGTAQYMAGGTEQINKVLGVLADNGIKGSEAGTHLRNMLLKLSSPTKEGAKALEELGVNVFDSEGKMRDFAEVFPELNASMAHLTEEEKLQKLSTIFNARDIASVNALLGTTPDRWDEVASAIDNCHGAAEQMAQTQLDNLAGDITLFESALEGAKIAISDGVAPALRGFVQTGTNLLSGFTSSLKEGGVSGALSFLGGQFTGLMKKADTVFPGIMTLWTTLQNVFGTVVDFIRSKSGDFGEIFDTIKGLFTAFVDLVETIWDNFGQTIMQYVGAVWDYVKNYIKLALDFIKNIIKLVTSIIKGDWKGAWEAIKNIFKNVWEQIKNVVQFALENIKVRISAVWTVVKNLTLGAWEGIKSIITNVWNVIKSTVSTAVSTVKTTMTNGFTSAKNTVSSIFDSIKSAISNKLSSARDTVKSIIDRIKSFFNFSWSLPRLKLPHLSISGSFNLMPPSTPKFSIDWYKKAYNTAYLFDKPTVGVGLGFGDGVGGEMVVGESYLMTKIGDAFAERMGDLPAVVGGMYKFMEMYFPQFANMQMVVDGDKLVGAIAPQMDSALGRINVRKARG